MINVTAIAETAEERVLAGVKAGQAAVIDGLKNAVALADRVIPDNVSDRLEERVEAVPSAAPLVEGYFGLAGKLLDAQRDFVGQVVEILQPGASKTTKKASKTAKKTTKKASAAKTAKKAA